MQRKAPESVNLFATGMNGDEDLAQDIIMKGDKFHYQQGLADLAAAPVGAKPALAAARGEDPKEEPKKDDKKDAATADKDAKPAPADDKKDGKKDAKADAKDEKKDAKDEKKDGEEEEEKKEEAKAPQAPGEATWEEHNACKENEWEAGDGNCAFEAENLKLGRHNLL